MGGGGWWIYGEDGSAEGMPTPNNLGDHSGRHFKEGSAVEAPAYGPPGNKEQGRRGWQTHTDGLGMELGSNLIFRVEN